jgi:AraC-like DNA-binding protein
VFRKQTGQTIHTYLTQVRVLRALALIRAGEKIESVSQTVGYRSKKNFYRHFKEALGVTPVAYKTGMIALQLRPAVRPIPTNG